MSDTQINSEEPKPSATKVAAEMLELINNVEAHLTQLAAGLTQMQADQQMRVVDAAREGLETVAKYTMLANAGGLAFTVSQWSNLLQQHGHSQPVFVVALWAFGVGTLLSGLQLLTAISKTVGLRAAGHLDSFVRSVSMSLFASGVVGRTPRESRSWSPTDVAYEHAGTAPLGGEAGQAAWELRTQLGRSSSGCCSMLRRR